MKKATGPSVGKLLRVLVAGGVALAAPLAVTAAEAPEKAGATSTEKADTTPKPADAKPAKKKAAKDKHDKHKEKAKEPETEKKPAEAGGVKGW